MKHRNDQGGPRRGPGHAEHPHDRGHYASRQYEDAGYEGRDYEGMASVTNRQWGPGETAGDSSFGTREQGGYGDFRGGGDSQRGAGARAESGGYQRGQGGYAEGQGRYAQSGQSRGGSDYAHGEQRVSRGPTPVEPGRPSQRGRGPRNYTRSDTRIAEDLIDRLTDDEQLDAREILVMVEDGVVTLTGEVESRGMKHRAEDIAAAIDGVRDVDNRIAIDNGERSFGPPGEAVRSGRDQRGSGFSSSARIGDPVNEQSTRAGRAGPEPETGETVRRGEGENEGSRH